jgi:predicted metal-binding membrane protein
VATGYFLVWTVIGVAVFPFGATLAASVMRDASLARIQPLAVAAVLLVGGALQFTSWKARQLALCRGAPRRNGMSAANSCSALLYGLCVGLHCVRSCIGLTAVMLATGMMDLRMMSLVALAITAERLAPSGVRVARAVGAVVVGTGLYVVATVAWLP